MVGKLETYLRQFCPLHRYGGILQELALTKRRLGFGSFLYAATTVPADMPRAQPAIILGLSVSGFGALFHFVFSRV